MSRRRLSAAFFVAALCLIGLFGISARVLRKAIGVSVPHKPAPRDLIGVTVVLDPGHGGTDSGARVAGLREDELNYRLASTVAAALQDRGATIVYTVRSRAILPDLREGEPEPPLLRPSDSILVLTSTPVRLRGDNDPADLYRRAAIAANIWRDLPADQRRSGKGLYFLALHCDTLGRSPGRGARVYYDRRDPARHPCRLARILKRRLTLAGLTNSLRGEVIPRQFGVLNPQYNPVPERALVEMLTLSDKRDRQAAMDTAWRWRLAKLIAQSVAECEHGGA